MVSGLQWSSHPLRQSELIWNQWPNSNRNGWRVLGENCWLSLRKNWWMVLAGIRIVGQRQLHCRRSGFASLLLLWVEAV